MVMPQVIAKRNRMSKKSFATNIHMILTLTVLVLSLVVGCDHAELSSDLGPYRGDVRLFFFGASSRTIDTDIDMRIVSYGLEAIGPNGSEVSLSDITEESVLLNNLDVGTWQITIDGYNPEGIRVGSGCVTVQVSRGLSVQADVHLVPLEGEGSYALDITWDSSEVGDPSISGRLFSLSDEDSSEIAVSFHLHDGLATASGTLDSGYYGVIISLSDGDAIIWTKTDILRIVADGDSAASYAVSGSHADSDVHPLGFLLGFADNPDTLFTDSVGEIDQESRRIRVSVPVGTILSALVPRFITEDGVDLYVDGVRQISGESVQDFSTGVIYGLYRGETHLGDYLVEVHPEQTVLEIDRHGAFSVSLDFSDDPKDVWYILTNPSTNSNLSVPSIGLGAGYVSTDRSLSVAKAVSRTMLPDIRQKSGVDEFNRQLPSAFPARYPTSRHLASVSEEIRFDDARLFSIDYHGTNHVPAICKKVRTGIDTLNGTKNLYIWVEERSWSPSGDRAFLVTQQMVDVLADKFLVPGPANDIYDWVTAIYGEEWGASEWPNLIPDTDDIHILLKDIDGDDSTDGGVLGYYWAKDNYLASSISGSNESLVFYLDSVLLANPDGTEWEADDYWPGKQISTLAHEFQHMIHFYQKNVLRDVSSEVWLNEMCSLVTEDLVADKLMLSGPRGVPVAGTFDYSGGTPGLLEGRLPLFNRYNDQSVNVWLSGDEVLRSYATAYAFGAYLCRNHGGATLFNAIMDAQEGDHRAIEAALATSCPDLTFADVLVDWGKAVVLSDSTDTEPYTSYNNGSWFASSQGGVEYHVGSINLENYSYASQAGPHHTISGTVGRGLKASNAYFKESSVVRRTYEFSIPDGYVMTLVVR